MNKLFSPIYLASSLLWGFSDTMQSTTGDSIPEGKHHRVHFRHNLESVISPPHPEAQSSSQHQQQLHLETQSQQPEQQSNLSKIVLSTLAGGVLAAGIYYVYGKLAQSGMLGGGSYGTEDASSQPSQGALDATNALIQEDIVRNNPVLEGVLRNLLASGKTTYLTPSVMSLLKSMPEDALSKMLAQNNTGLTAQDVYSALDDPSTFTTSFDEAAQKGDRHLITLFVIETLLKTDFSDVTPPIQTLSNTSPPPIVQGELLAQKKDTLCSFIDHYITVDFLPNNGIVCAFIIVATIILLVHIVFAHVWPWLKSVAHTDYSMYNARNRPDQYGQFVNRY